MEIKKVGKFDFDMNSERYKKFRREIPNILATEAVNHFKEAFTPSNAGRRTDASKEGWAKKRSGEISYLVKSGKLVRDIQKIKLSFDEIIIGTSAMTEEYAQRHNEGITDKRGRKMPKREFIGNSKELTEKNDRTIEKELRKVFQ